jgi:hypothetical protein
MRLGAAGLLIAAIVGGQAPPTGQAPPAVSPLGGRLQRAIFGVERLTPSDIERAPEADRDRLRRYAARAASFRPAPPPDDSPTLKRYRVERAIVALIEAHGIEQAAASYAAAAAVAYEWEGRPEGPLKEAGFAEAFLKKDPQTALAPYLYLFLAHRYRAAFEAAVDRQRRHKDDTLEAQKNAARKYRAFLERARKVADPIFPLAASDLDAEQHVYVDVGLHPRTFNPDG